MPHDLPGSRDTVPRLNLAQSGDVLDMPSDGPRLTAQLSPTPGHSVGVGAAIVIIEWSMDHDEWIEFEIDGQPVELDNSARGFQNLNVAGVSWIRFRVKTADGTADSVAAIFMRFHSDN